MYVIRHQRVRMPLALRNGERFAEPAEVQRVVMICKETRHPIVAPLDDV
jgi:hypothetical protein